ncbi:hypothetical protein LPJ77_001998 [Coemansia sp. RSA 2523]|nr:hypothetical protein LPJ58_002501 [Coemansia sp. RSA 1591]KAJ1763487.1 hypothetical protein LPJ69_002443 [Coemansia sp. RSA 1752]KAJ1778682.1 hypothetical protein LPJ54_001515 [Coemansia sp. RSA 1824]KAJ1786999.1 hypothetical protein LPJ62_003563 [Coemansia sp. RSA 2167]KAJ1789718.1 hypothetical protein LPJ67_002400 [Coemansia sp. RSA 1938]KAJ1808952.1 hypothetical protein LPJ77_001998 [Coemansia sp. RSA 2523]KAJ2143494.1 hypothetical protein IW142_003691 [Coemansia sp. RSA 564]KAJ2152047
MDLLKETINREVKKRKSQYERAANDSTKSKHKKYVRVVDLENASPDASTSSLKPTASTQSAAANASAKSPKIANTQCTSDVAKPLQLASSEVIKRLRARNEPTRLFGETDTARHMRLRALELSEEKHDGQQNEFHRVLAQVEAGAMLSDLKRQAQISDDTDTKRQNKLAALMEFDVSDISPSLLRTDMDRVYSLLYVYFKRLVYEWDDFLDMRSSDEQRSADGKMAAATQRQSAEYLRPLFRSLKSRTLQADVLQRITEIARHMLDREYMHANDAYLQLSIGNAPWPVGVTQVGIHSRASRETINANKVAHVLNNETQRKWIQSIKRLIRFAQTKYPPSDLAKMAG